MRSDGSGQPAALFEYADQVGVGAVEPCRAGGPRVGVGGGGAEDEGDGVRGEEGKTFAG